MTEGEYRRSDPAQEPPPPDLTWVPEGSVSRAGWFREHRHRSGADRGCWYFASLPSEPTMPSGRFDLPAPEGTCYFGDSESVAALERVGRFTTKHQPVPGDFVQGRVVTRVDGGVLPSRAANLCSRRTSGVGVTGELFTMSDYAVPQMWAAVIRGLGHSAIRYPPRFSPGGVALACFGDAGSAPRPVAGRRSLRDVLDRIGVEVAEVPSSAEVHIVEPTS